MLGHKEFDGACRATEDHLGVVHHRSGAALAVRLVELNERPRTCCRHALSAPVLDERPVAEFLQLHGATRDAREALNHLRLRETLWTSELVGGAEVLAAATQENGGSHLGQVACVIQRNETAVRGTSPER